MVAYQDLNLVQNPAAGVVASSAWGDQVRDNFEYLATPPQCSIGAVGSTGVPTGTLTALPSSVEFYDTDGMHAGTNSYITINTPGRYLCFGTASFDADSNGTQRYAEIFMPDGTPVRLEFGAVFPCWSPNGTIVSGMRSYKFFGGERIQMRVRHDAGHSLPVTMDELNVQWVGR